MEVLTKKRLLIWTIVILIIMNVSALSTIAFHRYKLKKHMEQVEQRKNFNKKIYDKNNYGQRIKIYVRRELNLSEKQFRKYSQLKDINLEKSEKLRQEIMRKRDMTFREYCKTKPDTILLNQLSEDIGNLHKQLHQEMLRHFNEVEKILIPEQKVKFSHLLCKMAHHPPKKKKSSDIK